MSSVLEKITLYDFFCYLIPGTLFESLVAIIYLIPMVKSNPDFSSQISDFSAFLVVLLLLFGYVTGILISEIAKKFADSVGLKAGFYEEVTKNAGCNSRVLQDAFVKSRLLRRRDVENREAPQLIKEHMRIMRALLQIDTNYKRMHDYSSFSTMCKNLSVSFLLAGIVNEVGVTNMAGDYLLPRCAFAVAVVGTFAIIVASVIPYAFAAMVLWRRFSRFEMKQAEYTVIWFMDKEVHNSQAAGEKRSS